MGITYLDDAPASPSPKITYLDDPPAGVDKTANEPWSVALKKAGGDALDVTKGFVEGAVTTIPKAAVASAQHTADFLRHPIDTVKGDAGKVKDAFDYLTSPDSHPMQDVDNWASNLTPEDVGNVAGSLVAPGTTEKMVKGIAAAPRVAQETAVKFTAGMPNRTRELAARALEGQGIKIEAPQVRADNPTASSGFMGTKDANQSAAHRVVTQDTGRIATGDQGIDQGFLDERFTTLGKHYDEIFNGRTFEIPQSTLDELRAYYDQESSIRPAHAKAASNTARSILDAAAKSAAPAPVAPGTAVAPAVAGAAAPASGVSIQGEGLQRLRNELARVGRTSADADERAGAWDMIDKLDQTIAANNPLLADVLNRVNTQYRATAALSDAAKAGKIQAGDLSPEGFGSWLRSNPRRGTPAQREFGRNAEAVNLQGRFERGSGSPAGGIGAESVWQDAKKAVNFAARTQWARNIQRRLADTLATSTPETITTAQAKSIKDDLEAIRRAEAGGQQPRGWPAPTATPSAAAALPPPEPFNQSPVP